MMHYDRRPVERRLLPPQRQATPFQYWILALILIAFLLSLVK